jgi:hypothetical protein
MKDVVLSVWLRETVARGIGTTPSAALNSFETY